MSNNRDQSYGSRFKENSGRGKMNSAGIKRGSDSRRRYSNSNAQKNSSRGGTNPYRYIRRTSKSGNGEKNSQVSYSKDFDKLPGSDKVKTTDNIQDVGTPDTHNSISEQPPTNNKKSKNVKPCGGCTKPGARHRRRCKNKQKQLTLNPTQTAKVNKDSKIVDAIVTDQLTSQKESHPCQTEKENKADKPITVSESKLIQKVKLEKAQEEQLLKSEKQRNDENLSCEIGGKRQEIINNLETSGSSTSETSSSTESVDLNAGSKNAVIQTAPACMTEPMKPGKTEKNQKKLSDEEVVFLGKLERFEDLVDDEEDSEKNQKEIETSKKCIKKNQKEIETSKKCIEKNQQEIDTSKKCFICGKEGHNSFECQMICKNCSGLYHNLKTCPNPVNISLMMQHFLEFCMKQCCQFDPNQKFQQIDNSLWPPNISKRKRKSSKTLETPHSHRKRKRLAQGNSSVEVTTESDSSSEVQTSTKRRNKKTKSKRYVSELNQQYPNFNPFAQAMPFAAYSGHTTSTAFNPLMAFNPMMHNAFNPKFAPIGLPP